MKLERIWLDNTQIHATCRVCGLTKNMKVMYADRDGVPFYDYYCETCVQQGKVHGTDSSHSGSSN